METPEQYTPAQYYKKYFSFTEKRRHDDCDLTWDQVIIETGEYAALQNAELIKCLKMIDECLKDGIPIEKNDPIHAVIKKLLKS